jgi:dsRNA-specific ribonuclease
VGKQKSLTSVNQLNHRRQNYSQSLSNFSFNYSLDGGLKFQSFEKEEKERKKEKTIFSLFWSVNGSITLKISGVLTGGYFRLRNSLIRIFVEKNI